MVEEIQADPTAMRRWGDVPEAVEAMGEFRKLQAFCTPRGLKTNLTRLARTEEVTPDAARARATRCGPERRKRAVPRRAFPLALPPGPLPCLSR